MPYCLSTLTTLSAHFSATNIPTPSVYTTGTILHIITLISKKPQDVNNLSHGYSTMPSQEIKHTTMFAKCYTATAATYTQPFSRLASRCPGLPRWAGTTKVKPIWILLKQETVSGSGISWAICKSAPCSRQTTTPAPHQQHQSTEGTAATYWCKNHKYLPVTKPEKSSYTKQDVDKVCVQWTGDFITPWDRTKLGKLAFSLAMPHAWNLMPESTADSSILTVNNFVLTTSTVRKLTLCPNIVLNYN